ncbi:hypothetical protein [Leptospira sarikeiensis]|uniref:Uncharacterized protein n=1 Tax=Leptospira sarikeiensis TaxID=2484943 RepID=A0A4R9KB10_9LEPT|nr:hypothetical protein [Leptospira sarikeiensis]TGL63236.1 hypothetical protein EHQ64_04540 [Leptospira sarikeiensis]
MPLTIGDVFVWENFDNHNDGSIKNAWFVYIGKTGLFSEVSLFYILRTTTQLHHYENTGSRHKHITHIFDPSNNPAHTCFDSKCLLDLTEKPFEITRDLNELERLGKLNRKGSLPLPELAEVFKKLCNSKLIPKITKRNIRDSLRAAGVKGLPDQV